MKFIRAFFILAFWGGILSLILILIFRHTTLFDGIYNNYHKKDFGSDIHVDFMDIERYPGE